MYKQYLTTWQLLNPVHGTLLYTIRRHPTYILGPPVTMFPPAALPGAVLLLAALAVAEQRVLGHPVSAGSLYNSAALQGHCITVPHYRVIV